MFRRIALAALLAASFAGGCADEQPLPQSYAHTDQRAGELEVLLTAPHCDVCTSQDKDVLRARSLMIARVVELVDGAETSVDVAQFTFSVSEIADALMRAHERGVTVRLAMDAGQDRDGTRARKLKDGGIDVRFVKGRAAGSHDGLQHAKFMVVDGATLLTGSNNFSSTGTTINEENAVVLYKAPSDPLLEGFRCHFEAIWASDHDAAGACTNERVAFSPSSAPRKLVRDRIRAAEQSVDVIMHHLSFGDLVKELRKAAERGVGVRVLLNETTRGEHTGADWDALVAAGGRIRYKRVNEDAYQLLHHKLAIVDGRVLVNGSGNWSGSAFFNNFENYVVYEEAVVLRPFRAMFHRLWNWSLNSESIERGRDPATQHADLTRPYFGSLHAHMHAVRDGVALDDGHPQRLDDAGEAYDVDMGDSVADAARYAYQYARDEGGLDFVALSPHCREEIEDDTNANMDGQGYGELLQAAEASSSAAFVAMAGMEWSTNSAGNHLGVVGSSAISKVEAGRFDAFYGGYLQERDAAGDRPLLMFNHPKTFRTNEATLQGSWDMVFGVNLLDVPKASERKRKFNDFGIDDFLPLKDVHAAWVAGEQLPDEQIVNETWKTVIDVAGPYVRLMEVTLNRGKDLGSETPANPSIVESRQDPEQTERRTKVHTDFDYFLTRGFRLAPVASHDNHYANWGRGHTSRTAIIAEALSQRQLLDGIEQREAYASEDENLELGFYVQSRIPMGGSTATTADTVSARVRVADADYDGRYTIRIYRGTVDQDGVTVVSEQTALEAGWHDLTLDVAEAGTHFFYVEVHESDVDRMAWSAPIWVERL